MRDARATLQALLPRLQPGARIIDIVTKLQAGMRLDLDDPQGERRYRGFDAYAGAKVGLLAWTLELARRVEDRGILVNAVHPGVVMGTSFGADMPWVMRCCGRWRTGSGRVCGRTGCLAA